MLKRVLREPWLGRHANAHGNAHDGHAHDGHDGHAHESHDGHADEPHDGHGHERRHGHEPRYARPVHGTYPS